MVSFGQQNVRVSRYRSTSIKIQFDVKVIAQWQGHQDGGKLILGTYSHVRNVRAEEMAKKLV